MGVSVACECGVWVCGCECASCVSLMCECAACECMVCECVACGCVVVSVRHVSVSHYGMQETSTVQMLEGVGRSPPLLFSALVSGQGLFLNL